jgi:hypothetical protein
MPLAPGTAARPVSGFSALLFAGLAACSSSHASSPFSCADDPAGTVSSGTLTAEASAPPVTQVFAALPASLCCGSAPGELVTSFVVSPDGAAVAAITAHPAGSGFSSRLFLGALDTAAPPAAPYLDAAFSENGWFDGPGFSPDGRRFGYRRMADKGDFNASELLWADVGSAAPVLVDTLCIGPDTGAWQLANPAPWPWGGRDLFWQRLLRSGTRDSATSTVSVQVARQPDWSAAASPAPAVVDSFSYVDGPSYPPTWVDQAISPSGERFAWIYQVSAESNGVCLTTSKLRSWGPDGHVYEVAEYYGLEPAPLFVTEGLLLGRNYAPSAVDPRASARITPWDGRSPAVLYEPMMAQQSSTFVTTRWDGAHQLIDVFEGAATRASRSFELPLAQGDLQGLLLNTTGTRLVYWTADGRAHALALTGSCSGVVELGAGLPYAALRDWVALGTRVSDTELSVTLVSLDGRVTAQPPLRARIVDGSPIFNLAPGNLTGNADGTQLAYRSAADGLSHVLYLDGPILDRALPAPLASAPSGSLFFWRGDTLVYGADGDGGSLDLWGAHRTLGVGRLGSVRHLTNDAGLGLYPRGVVFNTVEGFSVSRLP